MRIGHHSPSWDATACADRQPLTYPTACARWPNSFTSMSADFRTRPDLSLSLIRRHTVDGKILACLVGVSVFSRVAGLATATTHSNVRGVMAPLRRFIWRLAVMVEGEMNQHKTFSTHYLFRELALHNYISSPRPAFLETQASRIKRPYWTYLRVRPRLRRS
jgi:hypothetical protein